MKNIILLALIFITQKSFSQEKKIELKIRETSNLSISKVSNDNIIERKIQRDDNKISKSENIRHEKHIRPHFEKNTLKDHDKRENLKREHKYEIRHNRSERNNR